MLGLGDAWRARGFWITPNSVTDLVFIQTINQPFRHFHTSPPTQNITCPGKLYIGRLTERVTGGQEAPGLQTARALGKSFLEITRTRILRWGDRSKINCDRRKRCRFERGSARICNRAATARGRPPARVNRAGPIYRRRSAG